MLVDYHVNPLLKDGGSGGGSGEGRTCLDIARLHNRNGKSDALVSLLEEAEMEYNSRHGFDYDNDNGGDENHHFNHQESGGTNQKRVEGTNRGTKSGLTDKETQDGTEEVDPLLSSLLPV